jgi:hypothetical protein
VQGLVYDWFKNPGYYKESAEEVILRTMESKIRLIRQQNGAQPKNDLKDNG